MTCRLGIITGSGTYSLGGFESVAPRDVQTPFGTAHVNIGHLAGRDVVHVSRHLEGHRRLSSQVTHQANVSALRQLHQKNTPPPPHPPPPPPPPPPRPPPP